MLNEAWIEKLLSNFNKQLIPELYKALVICKLSFPTFGNLAFSSF